MEITPDVIASFRGIHVAFVSVEVWSDKLLESHLCDADAETGGAGWGEYEDVCGNFKQRGMFNFAAHSLLSTYPNGPGVNSINADGKYPTASKSVGDESSSYAVVAQANAGESWLSSTSYGQQFIRLRRRAGMGAIAV